MFMKYTHIHIYLKVSPYPVRKAVQKTVFHIMKRYNICSILPGPKKLNFETQNLNLFEQM